ncbi:HD domain-containing protein [Mucilaginibacter agri]|uniref:HD domain-containing protein n=1 Tax=Mucilaginibacter agri TaxID=2695265 RepID=A0A965ZI87_9SPHI|nr:HD domain-containing protein [Mucilaginibacter agri]NCD70131.1 HD domain-containing protein [Mucilaginibacter agri]
MIVTDKIYGSFRIDPVLAELVNSAPVQRLKNIHQGGAIFLVNPAINHTRYEHSIGVLYLVKLLGGGLGEQIAALLHDVSHTAFSHVADYVFDHNDEDYHETIFDEVINQSEIPAILRKYGLNSEFLFKQDYAILEQPLPQLCADRVDYTLRDLFNAGLISLRDIQRFLPELTLQDGKMVVRSEAAGQWIKDKFTQLNNEYFKKPEHVYANLMMAELLREALANNLLQKTELLNNDLEVLNKLVAHESTNRKLNAIKTLERFNQFHSKGAADRFKRRELHPAILV